MNRRNFFKTLAAVAAVASLPAQWIVRKYRKLRGDGVTDDTEALQALLNGEPVEMPDGTIQVPSNGVVSLPAGTFRVTGIEPLHARNRLTGEGPGKTVINLDLTRR